MDATLLELGKTVLVLGIQALCAAVTVRLLRRRWTPPATAGRRARRITAITLAAIAAALLWQLLLTLAATLCVLALIFRRPARRPRRTSPAFYDHGYPTGGVSGRSHHGGRSAADDYWDQRARHDQQQRHADQYEADMYRWGHRHHPPPGYWGCR